MAQASVTRRKAVKSVLAILNPLWCKYSLLISFFLYIYRALKENDNDIVNSIMALSV